MRVLVRDPEKAGRAGRRGCRDRRRRPGRPGEHRRGDGRRHLGDARQPGRARAGAERGRQRRPGRRRARRQGHQQGVGRLAHRPATRADRDRGRPGRLRAAAHAAAVQRLHAEHPDAGAGDRHNQRLRLVGRPGPRRHGRRPRRRGGGGRDRRLARPARREDLLAHRPGADLQLRRGRRALEAARPDHHLPGAQLRRAQGRDDRCRRPGAVAEHERPGVQPDRRGRRRVGQRRRRRPSSVARPAPSSSSPPTTPPRSPRPSTEQGPGQRHDGPQGQDSPHHRRDQRDRQGHGPGTRRPRRSRARHRAQRAAGRRSHRRDRERRRQRRPTT